MVSAYLKYKLYIFIGYSFAVFFLSSCAPIITQWPPRDDRTIAIIGPLNAPTSTHSYKKARLVGLAIDQAVQEQEKKKKKGKFPKLKRLSWIQHSNSVEELWHKLEKIRLQKKEAIPTEAIAGIFSEYESIFPYSHLLFLRVNQDLPLKNYLKVEFYRLIISSDAYIEANHSSVWFDQKKGDFIPQVRDLIKHLAEGKKYASPSFESLGFKTIPAGCYKKSRHKICVKSFNLGRFPVTQKQWMGIMKENPAQHMLGGLYPIESISWTNAARFIERLNDTSPFHYRFPTRAELEYVCQVRSKGNLWGVDSKRGDTWHGSSPVGKFPGNNFGLYDIQGNVREWTQTSELRIFSSFISQLMHQLKTLTQKKSSRVVVGSSFTSTTKTGCGKSTLVHKENGSADIGIRLVVEY